MTVDNIFEWMGLVPAGYVVVILLIPIALGFLMRLLRSR